MKTNRKAEIKSGAIFLNTWTAIVSLATIAAAVKAFKSLFGVAPTIEIRGRFYAADGILNANCDVLDLAPAVSPDRRYRANLRPGDTEWIEVKVDHTWECVRIEKGTSVEVWLCLPAPPASEDPVTVKAARPAPGHKLPEAPSDGR